MKKNSIASSLFRNNRFVLNLMFQNIKLSTNMCSTFFSNPTLMLLAASQHKLKMHEFLGVGEQHIIPGYQSRLPACKSLEPKSSTWKICMGTRGVPQKQGCGGAVLISHFFLCLFRLYILIKIFACSVHSCFSKTHTYLGGR